MASQPFAWVDFDGSPVEFIQVPIVHTSSLEKDWNMLDIKGAAVCRVVAASILLRADLASQPGKCLDLHGPHTRSATYEHVDDTRAMQEAQLGLRLQEYVHNARPSMARMIPSKLSPLLQPLPALNTDSQQQYDLMTLADLESEAFAVFDTFANTNRLTPQLLVACAKDNMSPLSRMANPIFIFCCGPCWGLLLPRVQTPTPAMLLHWFRIRTAAPPEISSPTRTSRSSTYSSPKSAFSTPLHVQNSSSSSSCFSSSSSPYFSSASSSASPSSSSSASTFAPRTPLVIPKRALFLPCAHTAVAATAAHAAAHAAAPMLISVEQDHDF